jgi:hypothetical protein
VKPKSDEEPKPDDAAEKPDETILLKDLAPRKDVKGGAGKLRFGESTVVDSRDRT